MSADEEKAKLDHGIFSAIMSNWDIGDVDSHAIAEKFETSQQKVAAMIFSAKTTPRAYLALVEAGAAPRQIPPWITRPGTSPDPPIVPPEAPIETPSASLETPEPTLEQPVPPVEPGETLPLGERAQVPPGALRAPGGEPGEPLQGAGAGARLGGIYDGVRLQSERLSKLGIIRDQGGRYLKASTNLDGTPGFVEVDPAEVERDITQNIGTKISEAAVNDLNIHMKAVVRKIGLNPPVFMSYAWAVSEKRFEEDSGALGTRASSN
jgi:hypothetical protein